MSKVKKQQCTVSGCRTSGDDMLGLCPHHYKLYNMRTQQQLDLEQYAVTRCVLKGCFKSPAPGSALCNIHKRQLLRAIEEMSDAPMPEEDT